MRTRERILAIRLLEKVKDKPAYAKALGIEVGKEILISPARPGYNRAEHAVRKM